MRTAHFKYSRPPIHPTLLTNDFGDEMIVVPSRSCAEHYDVYDACIINEESWLRLFDMAYDIRDRE